MKALKQFAKAYLFSAWIPSVLAFVILGLLFLNELKLHLSIIGTPLLLAFFLSLIGILASAIIQLIKGRKLFGVINLCALPVVGFAAAQVFFFFAVAALFNDKPDDFGKDIVIPAGMEISDPLETFDEPGESVTDEFSEKIIAAFATNNLGNNRPLISTDLAVLKEFGTTNRQKLIQHLSASPRWFVTEERGKSYAYRRLIVDGHWQNSLNGYCSSFDVAPSSEPHFQIRVVIGFDGLVFESAFRKIHTATEVGSGNVPIRVIDDKESNQGKESYFILQAPRVSIEVFEQSRIDARPATQLALAEIKNELESALASTNAAFSLPTVNTNAAVIELAKGMQGGIYHVRAFVNPGEAGRVYLKVFEATRDTPLSAERIQPRSISRIGWSANPTEKFRYQSEITVYEGDWGNYYPGRFELWFIPDSGNPERKLIDRIFRIEGWMR